MGLFSSGNSSVWSESHVWHGTFQQWEQLSLVKNMFDTGLFSSGNRVWSGSHVWHGTFQQWEQLSHSQNISTQDNVASVMNNSDLQLFCSSVQHRLCADDIFKCYTLSS
ncbi:hypothetical protein BaRGS_00036354 [Batillaria attramentaria]|uniref:Uncharacterized protein n=1 Tax=Batillaria attramentaria TaxID=370345 RepID=A0ABD0JC28_9CAEN